MDNSQISFCGILAAIFFAASCPFNGYSQAPYLEWANYHNTGFSWGYDVCNDVNNNTYSAGMFLDTLFVTTLTGEDTLIQDSGSGDCFIQKMNEYGEILWAKAIHSSVEVIGYSLVTDSLENVYVFGRCAGTTDFDPGENSVDLTTVGTFDVFVLKLNVSGDFVWVKRMEGNSGSIAAAANCISLDNQNNLLLTGTFSGTVDFDPGPLTEYMSPVSGSVGMFIQKLDSAGNLIWIRTLKPDGGKSITSDQNGNIYITGGFIGTVDFDPGVDTVERTSFNLSYSDVYTLKLDTDGNFLWVNAFGGSENDYAYTICIDEAGNAYTVGDFKTTVDFDPDDVGVVSISAVGSRNTFIQKVDTDGNLIWIKTMESIPGGINYNVPDDATLDMNGNLIIIGAFNGTAKIYSSVMVENVVSNGNSDIYLQKLDANGNFIWGTTLGGTWYDIAGGISVDLENNMYCNGRFSYEVDFNPFGDPVLINTESATTFIAKYQEGYASASENSQSNFFKIYPNPTNGNQLLIVQTGKPQHCTVILTDLNGRIVKEVFSGFMDETTAIESNLNDLSQDIYLYIILLEDGSIYYEKTIKQ